MANPFSYVEIPVRDLDRAVRFYESVFGHQLERTVIDGYEMALFPADHDAPGAPGALVKGDVYVPAKTGPIVYMTVDSIVDTLDRARREKATVLYLPKDVGPFGIVAEIEDSEGNRIALHQTALRE